MKTSMFLVFVFLFCLTVLIIVYLKQNAALDELQNASPTVVLKSIKSPFDQLTFADQQKELKHRRNAIRKMATVIWDELSQIIWNETESPKTIVGFEFYPSATNSHIDPSEIILSSMTTLWLLNLPAQFAEGKEWIEHKFNYENLKNNTSENNIVEFIGELLSCYALTNDSVFLENALNIVDNLENKNIEHLFLNDKQYLEFRYFSYLSNNSKYHQQEEQLKSNLLNSSSSISSFSHSINNTQYYNLIKAYIQSNWKERDFLDLYKKALDSADSRGMFVKFASTNLVYVLSYNETGNEKQSPYMNYDNCYLGAMLALGATAMNRSANANDTSEVKRIERHWRLARNLTETCRVFASKAQDDFQRGPFTWEMRSWRFRGREHLFLEPHLVESYFILWRLTNDTWYLEYAWQLVQTIEQIHRNKNGLYGIEYSQENCKWTDQVYLPLHFFSTTLKFLYLIFAEPRELSINEWVFTQNGNPLPVLNEY